MIFAALAWGISLATGWGLLEALWPSRQTGLRSRGMADLMLRIGLSMGLGLFVGSVSYLLLMRLGYMGLPGLLLLDIVLLAAAWGLVRIVRPARSEHPSPDEVTGQGFGIASVVLVVGLTSAMLLAAAFAYRAFHHTPMGAWDAFAIWNLKARFFYGAHGADAQSWRSAFDQSIAWSHTDYPLLVPLGVARVWIYAGRESLELAAAQSVLYSLMGALVLFGAITRLRGPTSGCFALATLVTSAAALSAAADQLADVPVGFFFLASLVVLVLAADGVEVGPGVLPLVGILAGAAAWTKNEGFLMAVACTAAVLAAPAMDRGESQVRRVGRFALGLLVPLLCVAYLKLGLGGESDLLAGQSWQSFAKLFEPARHAAILASFASSALSLTGWPLLAILGLLAFAVGRAPAQGTNHGFRCLVLAMTIQLAGLYLVYLTTPRDLAWHLGSSNLRLFVQLWPSLVLLVFVSLGRPSPALASSRQATRS